MFKDIKLLLSIAFCCLLSCTTNDDKSLAIRFSADRSKIIFSNIEPVGLYELKTNIADSAYQALVTVLQTPRENDSTGMEIEWPGKLTIAGDQLVFTPKSPFVKGKNYLVETMINLKFATSKDIVKGQIGHYVKPKQILLKR